MPLDDHAISKPRKNLVSPISLIKNCVWREYLTLLILERLLPSDKHIINVYKESCERDFRFSLYTIYDLFDFKNSQNLSKKLEIR